MAAHGCLVSVQYDILVGADDMEDEEERVRVSLERCRRIGEECATSFEEVDLVRDLGDVDA